MKRNEWRQTKPGDKYNSLTFIKRVGYFKGNPIGLWECDCGETVEKPMANVVHGSTKSCGHIKGDKNVKKRFIEEKTEGMFDVDEYRDVFKMF